MIMYNVFIKYIIIQASIKNFLKIWCLSKEKKDAEKPAVMQTVSTLRQADGADESKRSLRCEKENSLEPASP